MRFNEVAEEEEGKSVSLSRLSDSFCGRRVCLERVRKRLANIMGDVLDLAGMMKLHNKDEAKRGRSAWGAFSHWEKQA